MNAVKEILAALRGLLVWWVSVAPWEQALRVRLGKRVKFLHPGVHLRIPGADRIYRQSVRKRASNQPAQTLTTKDGKALTVAVTVLYRIENLETLYETLHHPEGAISGVVLGAIAQWVNERPAAEVGPLELSAEVAKSANLERFGLGETEIAVNTFAFVKTYRFITGDGNGWTSGDQLDTAREDRQSVDHE